MMLSTTWVFELLNDIGIDRAQLKLAFESIFGVRGICHNIMPYCCSFVGPSCVREIFHEVLHITYGKA
jgi:hypothetical protein